MSQYKAPSVVYPVARSLWAAWTMAVSWTLAAVVTLTWTGSAGPGDFSPLWAWGALLLAGLALIGSWRNANEGQLTWDGERWLWTSRAYPAGAPLSWPEVVIDMQGVMVLHMVNPAGAALILWLEARQARDRWPDLRRAICARPSNGDRPAWGAHPP